MNTISKESFLKFIVGQNAEELLNNWNKGDLYDFAKELNIQNRSKMTKPQLAMAIETAMESFEMESDETIENTEIQDFKRYTELLEKVYSTKTVATEEEQQELDALGYKLELQGVPEIISEMNFNGLQTEIEKEQASVDQDDAFVKPAKIKWALEIRIRNLKEDHIIAWYSRIFETEEELNQEVDRLWKLKDSHRWTHSFEIEYIGEIAQDGMKILSVDDAKELMDSVELSVFNDAVYYVEKWADENSNQFAIDIYQDTDGAILVYFVSGNKIIQERTVLNGGRTQAV